MVGEKLHEYDLQLCDYVVSNIQQYMAEARVTKWIAKELALPGLLEYLTRRLDEHDDAPERLLLSDDEFEQLADTFKASPFIDYPWPGYSNLIHRRYINTVKEVRDALSQQVADDWSRECTQFAAQLEEDVLPLFRGIEIVRTWTHALRRLLSAMGATPFLPCPRGQSPTPTHPRPTNIPALVTQPPDTEAIEAMQEAILKHESTEHSLPPDQRGRYASADELTKIAHIRPQRARNALRHLEELGEYCGFPRVRPRRYLEGRRNER